MSYRIERKVSINLGGTSIKVADLKELLTEFPDETVMRVQFYKGSDQRDSDYATLIFTPPPPKGH